MLEFWLLFFFYFFFIGLNILFFNIVFIVRNKVNVVLKDGVVKIVLIKVLKVKVEKVVFFIVLVKKIKLELK